MNEGAGKENRGDKPLRLLRLLFVLALAAFFLAGLLRTALFPKEINYYENRTAERIDRPSLAGFLDGSFQDSMEAALADQIPGAQQLKKRYNDAQSAYLLHWLRRGMAAHPEQFFRYRDVYLHDGYVLWQPFDPEPLRPAFEATAEGFRRVLAANPGVDAYFYFIESDAVLDLKTGEKTPLYEELCDLLAFPADHCARFELNSLAQYQDCFYRTDHHWNHRGSYQGYCGILRLLGCGEEALQPLEEIAVAAPMTGSKATQVGLTEMKESCAVYRFDYPDLGAPYGHEEEVTARPDASPFSYSWFYGGDEGLHVFENREREEGTLLIIGDSFDNAVLKLIASHFHRTYSVDLRIYQHDTGEAFHFGDFVRTHEVDKLLILASQVVFCGDYILED